MNLKIIYIVSLLLLIGNFSYSQNNKSTSDSSSITKSKKETKSDNNKSTEKIEAEPLIFKPTIGLGVGLLSYYGNVYDKHFQSPTVARIGYELNVAQPLNDFLQFDFYALRGKLGADEREADGGTRNLNFQSQITVGGINFLYNFDNFLKKDKTVHPYITLGIEAFEYLSKTDLYDKYGNKYNYWSDGSIRNIAQNAPNASSAIIIQRDYTYETDIRSLNDYKLGKYPENSFAIPVGAGFCFKINDHINFKIGTTMHFTFTNKIDGAPQSTDAGKFKNDKFMMTSASLHYDFAIKKRNVDTTDKGMSDYDLAVADTADEDRDKVPDINDDCPGTPAGVAVDVKGCPLDDDNDGVPNYLDDEPNSAPGAIVDEKGVTLTDSILEYRYNVYMDSTGAFAKVEVHDHNGKTAISTFYTKEYMVELGKFTKGLPPELMTKFLSIGDIANDKYNDSTTIYTAGNFTTLMDAEKRKQELVAQGWNDAKVVFKQKGVYSDAPVFKSNIANSSKENKTDNKNTKPIPSEKTDAIASSSENKKKNKDGSSSKNEKDLNSKPVKKKNKNTSNTNSDDVEDEQPVNVPGLVLRVQLGAFKKFLPKSAFKEIGDLIEIKTADGLYKYTSGSYTNIKDAAKHKADLLLKGYQDAFIIAYKDGKRIPLAEAGATPMNKDVLKEAPETATDKTSKNNILFKVQVGKYKNKVPTEKLTAFTKMKDLTGETTEDGFTRYIVGSFKNYEQAENYRKEIIKKYGLTDAFVIALNNNELIPIDEALKLVK